MRSVHYDPLRGPVQPSSYDNPPGGGTLIGYVSVANASTREIGRFPQRLRVAKSSSRSR